MFGKPKNIKSPVPEPELHIQTIPVEFYGGTNPVVQFKNVKKEVVKEMIVEVTKRPAAPPGVVSRQPLARVLTSRKNLILGGSGLFILFAALSGVYYWQTTKPKVVIRVGQAPSETATPAVTTPEEPIEPENLPALEEAAATSPVLEEKSPEPAITYPAVVLGDSADRDKDGITDAAEELFKTDPTAPDTDKDKYSDGQEVYNLYNPEGQEPMRLIEAGTVKEHQNTALGYSIFYPTGWAVGNVDSAGRDVLFSTITGEYVEVRAFDKAPAQSFADWFARNAPGERFDALNNFESAFKKPAIRRGDNLVYYFDDAAHWYVIVYHTTESTEVNYRSVIAMMARSFRLEGSSTDLPKLIVEEGAEEAGVAATSTF
ncbi:MAG: hypothetical protein Q7K39_01300 [Candidatus Magasanikbacteria bacterium]|nr:hypothetical protein [Candidatus Magasanikbacteria bacterium]